MLSVSRPHLRPTHTSIARTILASVLILVWLAGVVPFSTLASKHECGMACCIGKPSHLSGSCSTAFSREEQAEPPAEPETEEAAHSDHMMHESGAASEIDATAVHHGAAKQGPAHHSTSGGESRRKAYAATQAVMTTPCSTECTAAAVYGSSQVRRPRDLASLTITAKLYTRTDNLVVRALSKPSTESKGHRGPARPRAPPFHLFNLSA